MFGLREENKELRAMIERMGEEFKDVRSRVMELTEQNKEIIRLLSRQN